MGEVIAFPQSREAAAEALRLDIVMRPYNRMLGHIARMEAELKAASGGAERQRLRRQIDLSEAEARRWRRTFGISTSTGRQLEVSTADAAASSVADAAAISSAPAVDCSLRDSNE